jgi:hypothetical protein
MTIWMQGVPSAELLTTVLEQLDDVLRNPGGTEPGMIAGEFDRLEELTGALPLTTDEYCFAINGIAGARQYWSDNESGTASYQLRMVRKKLAR